MQLPWKTSRGKNRLTIRASEGHLAYVLSEGGKQDRQGRHVLQWGAVQRGSEDAELLTKRMQGLAASAGEVIALLEPGDYQILKVDTPNVPNEELKAAARWQIKELVDTKLEELILDVMHVGGDQPRAQRHLYVIAARSTALAALNARADAGGLSLDVVDTWETALRNLQTLQAESENLRERACAALLVMGDSCLLTVSADGELYYTRRLDADPRLAERASGGGASQPVATAPLGREYQPGDDLNAIGAIGDEHEESVLIIELQRSIDLWERSWPELPLARLYVVAPQHADEMASLMQRELGLRTVALALPTLFSGLDGIAGREDELAACLPLLGAGLRVEQRVL